MMRQNPRLFRLSATVAIGALLCNAAVPVALAQPAPPPAAAPPAGQPDQNQGDPPDRVGRIASASGAVSFRTSADTQWSAATANYPVSSGNAFWTEPTARAELEISDSRIDLSGQTEFDVISLEPSGLEAVAPQGELYLHLADLNPNEVWSVQTPRGTIRLTQAGRYDIVVGTTDQPTQVTVLEGAAEVAGPGVSLNVAANQTATITGTDTYQGSVGAAVRDAFLAARLAAERPPAHGTASIPADVMHMPGGQDLQSYGEWSQSSDYGEVWYPPVPATWVPYRDGEWAYVAPWGWTWVDSAPWGFAPFHYGRWAHIDGRWGWVPGEERGSERPVYAPALVAFVGIGAGIAVGAALAGHSVGWVPLGPNEAYHPWYHASENYIRQVNTGHVKDMGAINNNVSVAIFANRAAATSVPASVMAGSRPVRGAARPLSAQMLASAHPVIGQQPLRPTVGTVGVTPAVARQLDLRAGGPGEAPRRAAPGPVVRVQEPGPGNGPPPRPALVGPHGEQPGAARPGAPGGQPPGQHNAPGQPAPRGPGGLPPLAAPGGRPAGVPGAGEPRPPGMPPGQHPAPGAQGGRPGGPEPGRPEPGGPEVVHPGGPPLAAPGGRPEGVPGGPPGGQQAHPNAEPVPGPREAHPEGGRPPVGPESHPPTVERPTPEPHPAAPGPGAPGPGGHEPPHVVTPEAAHPAPPPHVEAPRAPPPEAAHPAPPPHVEAPRAPPPHVNAPEPQRPAPPPPRPAAPPPRPAAPPPHPAAPPPHPAAPPPAAHPPEKKPGEH